MSKIRIVKSEYETKVFVDDVEVPFLRSYILEEKPGQHPVLKLYIRPTLIEVETDGIVNKITRANYNKCKECKWFNWDNKNSIGYECSNPDKKWRHDVSKYHAPSCKACKYFENGKENNNELSKM